MNGITFVEFKWKLMKEVGKLFKMKTVWEIYLANEKGEEECNCLVIEHRSSGWYLKFYLKEIYEEYLSEEYGIEEYAKSIFEFHKEQAVECGICKEEYVA